jgi:hypothetical protein
MRIVFRAVILIWIALFISTAAVAAQDKGKAQAQGRGRSGTTPGTTQTGSGHKAPNTQPSTATAPPAAPTGDLTLGTVQIAKK